MADAVVTVAQVKAFKTQSGNTRFVLRETRAASTRPSVSRSPTTPSPPRGGERASRSTSSSAATLRTSTSTRSSPSRSRPREVRQRRSRRSRGRRPWMPLRGCSAASPRRPFRRRNSSNACNRSRNASPRTSAGSPRTSRTRRGLPGGGLRAGRDRGAAALRRLAAPARECIACGGDPAEPAEHPEREHVKRWNPDPTQHVPSVAIGPLGPCEAFSRPM